MKSHPILFSGEMVRAILSGKKTQTRRIVKFPEVNGDDQKAEPERAWLDRSYEKPEMGGCACLKMPYGPEGCDLSTVERIFPKWQAGDQLWVKETHHVYPKGIIYRASIPTGNLDCHFKPWKPSIFMRREYSRITLEIVSVRVERLQDISEADAIAEGVDGTSGALGTDDVATSFFPMWMPWPVRRYALLWSRINGAGSWESNPWVFVVEFKIKPCGPCLSPLPQPQIGSLLQ